MYCCKCFRSFLVVCQASPFPRLIPCLKVPVVFCLWHGLYRPSLLPTGSTHPWHVSAWASKHPSVPPHLSYRGSEWREARLVTARSCLVFPRLLCSGRTPLVCGSIQTSQLPSCQSACRLVSTLQRFSRKRRLLWRRESPSQSSEEQQVVLLNKKSQFRSMEFH